ncbi:MAG: flavodoxin domain-containing protein [Candidatus Bathyarchaeia archaeon]|jgi:NAD(P)H dehydrogenase (quinone)
MPKVLVAYYSKTGNTKQIAEAIAEGAKTVKGANVEIKNVENLTAAEAVTADGFAFGSPTYFSMMSGPMLTFLTELYFVREKLAGKTMVAFATGAGSQTKATENIESILKAFNPKQVLPGLAIGNKIAETDKQQAKQLGVKLAKSLA